MVQSAPCEAYLGSAANPAAAASSAFFANSARKALSFARGSSFTVFAFSAISAKKAEDAAAGLAAEPR